MFMVNGISAWEDITPSSWLREPPAGVEHLDAGAGQSA
jgi:hypothetical protein